MVKWLQAPRPSIGVPFQLPSRLLSISKPKSLGGSLEIKLVESSNLDATVQYAALSHPWGLKQPLKLLKDLTEVFKVRIPFDSLPATFQDAVTLVSSLKIPYLWVDSLCIIQDSKEDWQAEAALMASVYLQACVTVSAIAADDPLTGLDHHSMLRYPCEFAPKWRGFEGRLQGVGSIRLIDSGQFCEQVLRRPLFRRGWIYQEWLLSPRTIYYARDQLWWSSNADPRGHMYNETCTGHGFSVYRDVILTTPLTEVYTMNVEFSDEIAASPRSVWRNMLQDYTTRQFTYETDRLIAFAGIATLYRHLAHVSEDAYIAGLWRHSLLQDLLWTTREGRRVSPPQTYRAPSWSWASMEPIHVPFPKLTIGFMNEAGQTEWKHQEPPVVSVKDVEVTTPGPRLGSVSGGHLVLHGPLIRSHLSARIIDVTGQTPAHLRDEFFPGGIEKYVQASLSLHSSQPMTKPRVTHPSRAILDDTFPFYCSPGLLTVYLAVFDCHISLDGNAESHALLLMRSFEKGEYCRIGYALVGEDILHDKTQNSDFSDYVELSENECLGIGDKAGYYTYRIV
ncbi:Fc.00g094360.m01.CDS01 [Cosmosporella sp. VM-42]